MENNREDFNSVLPFLPPLTTQPSGRLAWPNHQVNDALTLLSQGPSQSQVNSGEQLFNTITRVRDSLPFSSEDHLARSTGNGFARFFDDLLPKEKSKQWFGEVIPVMADMVLRLPSLLEMHYRNCHVIVPGVCTGLRLLEPQQPGIVYLSQELIAALLSCSFFCLFPTVIVDRYAYLMQETNMDRIFASIHYSYHENQANKIKCIMNYFERVCSSTPLNFVSFERKVLSLENNPSVVALPSSEFWANSALPLCKFKVFSIGLIEDHPAGSLEVDFADEYIGGIVLTNGCLQEEIRFVINPELIAAMIFMPSMSENEAIEMVGAERFSNYTGYDTNFRYDGDHVDTRGIDSMGRRMTRVIAIDALRNPGIEQYKHEYLLREVNKAFCGFLDHSKYQQQQVPNSDVGVVTGNWGCGVFGGDPEIKSIIQWVAASQASRSFVSYYTFELRKLQNLDQVVEWIVSQKWSVGDLWNVLSDYCTKRANRETRLGFFSYLNPSLQQVSSHGSFQSQLQSS